MPIPPSDLRIRADGYVRNLNRGNAGRPPVPPAPPRAIPPFLSAARNNLLTAEYGKAIVFDYSYKYFYGDGFGKDFRILNLKH
ncbi:hypothetical protein, partial [Candidatus Solincola tengchongensis]|uniref:hypothetical protein n=1 Tax=Candidatus Solincola tengchongensis TaxID=2900693 RepID=UPI00258055D7